MPVMCYPCKAGVHIVLCQQRFQTVTNVSSCVLFYFTRQVTALGRHVDKQQRTCHLEYTETKLVAPPIAVEVMRCHPKILDVICSGPPISCQSHKICLTLQFFKHLQGGVSHDSRKLDTIGSYLCLDVGAVNFQVGVQFAARRRLIAGAQKATELPERFVLTQGQRQAPSCDEFQ